MTALSSSSATTPEREEEEEEAEKAEEKKERCDGNGLYARSSVAHDRVKSSFVCGSRFTNRASK